MPSIKNDQASGAKAWIFVLALGLIINPNLWVPLVKSFWRLSVSPISWQSANAISLATLLLGGLILLAGRYQRWRPVFFVYLLILITLGAAEAALRLIRPPAALIQDYGYPAGLLLPDPELGRRYAPDFSGRFTYLMYRDLTLRTNSLGFRDSEPNQSAAKRVIVLGDSIAFGSGIQESDRFTDVLERELTGQLDRPVDVQSWGINGTETNHQLLLYRKLGHTLPHDLVVIGFCLNDVVPVPVEELYQKTIKQARENSSVLSRLGESGLSLHYSFVVRLISQGLDSTAALIAGPKQSAAEKHRIKYRQYLTDNWDKPENLAQFAETIDALQAQVKANGARLAVLVFPYRFQFETGDFSMQEKLTKILTERQIPQVNLQEPFAQTLKLQEIYLTGDECHPNVEGHLLAGRSLIPLALRLLSAESPPDNY